MARTPLAVLMTLTLAGCDLSALLGDGPTRNCGVRQAFWPDEDGDGVGDPGSTVYIGCEAPEGYVSVPPPDPTPEHADSDGSADDSDDTGIPPGDSLPPHDSGLGDSSLPHDTDDSDQDPGDSDTDAAPASGS